MECENCKGLHGNLMKDEETVLCPDCLEAIKNNNERVETEQEALRGR